MNIHCEIQLNSNASVEWFKARLLKGFTQTLDIGFLATFVPILSLVANLRHSLNIESSLVFWIYCKGQPKFATKGQHNSHKQKNSQCLTQSQMFIFPGNLCQ